MKKKTFNNQLTNLRTFNMYKRHLKNLAENVFIFKNLPDVIDLDYVNSILVENGAIAFFNDEILGLLALPFTVLGQRDVYNRPKKIRVYGNNNYNKELYTNDYVIMYDNTAKTNLLCEINMFASRIALATRVIDINISQQKTPRVWEVPEEREHSFKAIINDIDSGTEVVTSYKGTKILDEVNNVLAPAPFVADKIQMQKNEIINEFLGMIGISNLTVQKKERLIQSEVTSQQGGTIASRYSRYNTRVKAIKEINKKFNCNIEVEYYDLEPSTIEYPTEEMGEEDFNV